MRVVLAPNAFKGTYDAVQVAEAWRRSLASTGESDLALDPRPLSDGGDGLVVVVRHYRPTVLSVQARVPDPLGRPVDAAWGWEPEADEAWIESAAAIGLGLLTDGERDPRVATSAGLGRLVTVAASLGARRLWIGLGGSATVDGGMGAAGAWGFRFEDQTGRAIERPIELERLARIVPPAEPPLTAGTRSVALVDVDAPLLGPAGAAPTFGPQKGGDPEAVERLAAGLARLAERWTADLGAPGDLAARPGAGAAGGLGAGLAAFLGARLEPGAAWCVELAGLEEALADADLLLTGEGHYDAQSAGGKATGVALERARAMGVAAAVVCAKAEAPPAPGAPDAGPLIVDAAAIGVAGRRLDLEDLGRLARIAVERAAGAG